MNKFEKLIECIVNEDNKKANDLFHQIVVEKSRKIYESLMDDDLSDDEIGGNEVEEFTNDISAEETGAEDLDDLDDEYDEYDDEAEETFDASEDSEELEDRVVDLEDKLDDLMAEFETMMDDGSDAEDDFGDADEDDFGGESDFDADDTDEDEIEEDDDFDFDLDSDPLAENVSLTAVAKPSNSEEANINKKSTVAANSGGKGASSKPVNFTSTEEKGNGKVTVKDQGCTTEPKLNKVAAPAKKPVAESKTRRKVRAKAPTKRR